jgi:hypothetical protein
MRMPDADALIRELRAQYPSLGGLPADQWAVDFDRDVR